MLRQLFQKEIRLQKSNLYFVLAIILVWGILLALATRAEVKLGGRPDVTMGLVVSFLQVGFVGFCLLAVAPLLVGAAMVAEERKLAVWEWQLSLPCPRRTQWAVKLAVGSAVTLALTLVVQPLLDFVLSRVMGSGAPDTPLPSSLLGMNEIYRTIPLLLMMSAAFVSSMSKDPYKAFFLGILFFGFVMACFSILDPVHLLILPWNLKTDRNVTRLLVSNHVPWMLGLGLSAGLGALSQFNFRLEGFQWRRFLCQLAAVVLLAAAATWIGLQLEFGIGGLVSQKARDVEPLILRNRSQAPGAGKTVDWAGIDPVLVQRFRAGDEKKTPVNAINPYHWQWDPSFVSRVIRIPGTGNVLAETPSFPVFVGTPDSHMFKEAGDLWEQRLPQAIEVGIDGSRFRPIFCLIMRGFQFLPTDSGYLIRSSPFSTFQSSWWPLPIKADGLLWKTLIRKPLPLDTLSEFYRDYRSGQIKIGGEVFQSPQIWPVNLAKGYFELTNPDKPAEGRAHEKWLIKKEANDTWTVVHKGKTYYSYYCVSDDGKWYSTKSSSGRYTGDSLPPSLDVYSCDHGTSWTLENPEGELDITSGGREDIITLHDMGTRSSALLRVSPSGRFLPFLRTKITIKLEVDGKELDTHYPEVVEFALLNLQTGQERVLLRTKPDRASQEEFQEVMKQWNLWKSRRESGQTGKEEAFHQEGRFGTYTGRNVPLYYQKFPPLLWTPDRDALAIFFDEKIYLFERRAQTAETAGKQVAIPENAARQASGQKPEQTAAQETGQTAAQETGQKAGQESAGQEPAGQKTAGQEASQNAGDFRLLGAVDLTGFQIRDVDFWNGGVMLAWGGTGLYRIELAKALKPAPPEQ
jgi:hypothetical protein